MTLYVFRGGLYRCIKRDNMMMASGLMMKSERKYINLLLIDLISFLRPSLFSISTMLKRYFVYYRRVMNIPQLIALL